MRDYVVWLLVAVSLPRRKHPSSGGVRGAGEFVCNVQIEYQSSALCFVCRACPWRYNGNSEEQPLASDMPTSVVKAHSGGFYATY